MVYVNMLTCILDSFKQFQAVTYFDESEDTKPTGDNMRKRGEKIADKQALLRIKMKTHTTTAHPKLSLMI